MRFNATANYHWVTSGRLSPLPEENYGAWKFGSINGENLRYMVVGAVMGEDYRICLGASDSDPGNEAGLYHHPNNRCFKVWRTGSTTLDQIEIFDVHGQVNDGNGNPLSGVTISNGDGRTTSTNSNGEYSFLNLESGSYILTVSKSGYTFTPNSRTVSGGPPFYITGQNFTGTDLYSISGRVTDGSGNPISDVTISDDNGHTSSTGGNGNYTMTGLDADTYIITPSKSGYTFSPISRSVTLPPSATGQDFNVTNRYAISGKITDGQGNPIADVPLDCVAWMTKQRVVDTTSTDNNGNYVFSDLPRGFYMVQGTSDSPYTLTPRVRLFRLPPSRSEQNFTTTPIYGTLTGRVTAQGDGKAISGARVSAGGQAGKTDGNGNYSLENLSPGDYNIYISASGYKDYKGQINIQANQNTVRNVALAPVRAEGYRLPYPGGRTYRCTQGNNSSYSHTGNQRYAFDFGTRYDSVVAARSGRVTMVTQDRYGGKYVRVRHVDGTDTLYLHLSQFNVTLNQVVQSGETIGRSGATGLANGAHLHFIRYPWGKWDSIPISFLDVSSNNGVPVTGGQYKSDNYRTNATMNLMATNAGESTNSPVGQLQIHATSQPTYVVRISASDYLSDNIQMRLSTTEADLSSATWEPVTDVITWTYPQVWGQFKNTLGNTSEIYSDTLDPIIYEPIEAAFDIQPTVCVGHTPSITNKTVPMCEQCGWLWDLGDGNYGYQVEPSLPYPYRGYLSPGMYTVTLSVANADSISSVSHQVDAIWGPASTFTITQSGPALTVTAWETNADSWEWSFGDGITATGRTATHTYASEGTYPVQLTVQDSNQCWARALEYVQVKQVYLPLVVHQ